MTTESLVELRAFAHEHGFTNFPASPKLDGKTHRFAAADKGAKNDGCSYLGHSDYPYNVTLTDFTRGEYRVTWTASRDHAPDDFDAAAHRAALAEAAAKREAEDAAAHARAVEKATSKWKAAHPADHSHPYLARKGAKPHAIRQHGDRLIIPMVNAETREITSIQTIEADGAKKFMAGGRTRATYYRIGEQPTADGTVILAEGFATGSTIHQATGGATVLVCFSAGNLEAVALAFRKAAPSATIIIAADDDHATHGNPGLACAREAALAANASVIVPDWPDGPVDGLTDFNDMARAYGLDTVRDHFAAPPPPAVSDDSVPFRFLGGDESNAYFLHVESGNIKRIPHTQLISAGYLIPLAPLDFWADRFGGRKGIAWQDAGNWLSRETYDVGAYKPDKVRGRGVWPESGGVVVHLGDRLLAPGVEKSIKPHEYISPDGYFYPLNPSLRGPAAVPATDAEAYEVLALFTDLLWSDASHGYLAAGWAALAPVCGALKWRPHIWVTGERGSGKSKIIEDLFSRVVPDAVSPRSNSTEAGIRQTLDGESLPVIFDEAEQTASGQHRVQRVLELMRQSSTASGGKVMKGTPHGESMSYTIASMFCLASITPGVREESDKSRICIVQLMGPGMVSSAHRAAHWAEYKPRLSALTEEHGRAIAARTIALLRDGKLHDIIDVFVAVAAEMFGDQRLGDQYGTLYAGAWTLSDTNVPTYDETVEFMASLDITATDDAMDSHSEADKLMAYLLQATVSWEDGDKTRRTSTLATLIRAATSDVFNITRSDADHALQELMMRADTVNGETMLTMAYTSRWVDEAVAKTAWANGWKNVLKQAPGVESSGSVRYRSHGTARGIVVPVTPNA